MPLKLYEFPAAYRSIWDRVEEDDDATSEAVAEALKAEFDSLEGAYAEKIENIAKLIQSLSAGRDAVDGEAKRLGARAAAMARKIDWLQGYLVDSLREVGHTKIEGDILNVTLATNQRVELDSQEQVPEEFRRVVTSEVIDKREIRQRLKDGDDIPGARLVETYSIRIR